MNHKLENTILATLAAENSESDYMKLQHTARLYFDRYKRHTPDNGGAPDIMAELDNIKQSKSVIERLEDSLTDSEFDAMESTKILLSYAETVLETILAHFEESKQVKYDGYHGI